MRLSSFRAGSARRSRTAAGSRSGRCRCGWDGVRLSEIARLVEPDPRARYVEFRSFEPGYYSSWDLESALHPQTILAYGMNGVPLAQEYGAPLRLYSAVKLGYKMVKYLAQVSFLPVRTGGYWEDQGYEWFAGV